MGASSSETKHKSKSAPEWNGPCCGGTHYWGHGAGCTSRYGGGKYYKCGQCRKVLAEKLNEDEMLERALDLAESKYEEACAESKLPSN